MTRWVAVVAVALALAAGLTRGGEARALDGGKTEMWFVIAETGESMFVGSMANEQTCETASRALARDRHAQGQATRLAVFDCRELRVEAH
jgi:hypothetical protein